MFFLFRTRTRVTRQNTQPNKRPIANVAHPAKIESGAWRIVLFVMFLGVMALFIPLMHLHVIW